MLAGVRFVGVHARRLHVVEAIPRPMKRAPEVQVAQQWLAFDRLTARLRFEWLEVRLADQNRGVAMLLKDIADCRHIFRQLDADCPAAVAGRVHTGDQ